MIKFTATVELAKKTATGIQVPETVVEQLCGGKRPPVKVTINDYTYQNTIAVMNGQYLLAVSAEVREKAGINAGDVVEVELALDTAPREVEVPSDLQEALDANSAAKIFFDSLSNSNKKRFIIPIDQAKTPETRTRRIEKAIIDLAENKKI